MKSMKGGTVMIYSSEIKHYTTLDMKAICSQTFKYYDFMLVTFLFLIFFLLFYHVLVKTNLYTNDSSLDGWSRDLCTCRCQFDYQIMHS